MAILYNTTCFSYILSNPTMRYHAHSMISPYAFGNDGPARGLSIYHLVMTNIAMENHHV